MSTPLCFEDKVEGYDEDSLPPLGLGYIATSLQKHGLSVELHDAVASNKPVSDIIRQINVSGVRTVGLNVFTTNLHLVRKIVEGVSVPVQFILGGLSTKSIYGEIFEWETSNSIDIVMGDGEIIMPDLVNGCECEPPVMSSDTDGRRRRYFSVDSNSHYYVNDINGVDLNRSFFSHEPIHHPVHGIVEANIVATRGCIYNCAFCSAAKSKNKHMGVRERSPVNIKKEVLELKDFYEGLSSVRVLDDLFLKNRGSVENAIKIFEGTDLSWRAMAHVGSFRNVNEELLKRLKESGCLELFIGIESGSQKMLKMIHKTHNLDLISKTITKILNSGISVKGFFIYGFPGETEEDCEDTFRLASSLKESSDKSDGDFRTSVFRFRPYHGTELYDLVSDSGTNDVVHRDLPLSHLKRRQQFNFATQNYSACSDEIIAHYISVTDQLNDR
ncbi:B12-binding domain-containing radical SAM protein [Candidatus Peregrinibacteria bacterium]|nr:MAG: B12-binding domain-containing radical SAM protein [Candidatus Peregrinibacteria bacterium]